jgi:hypothetical protein
MNLPYVGASVHYKDQFAGSHAPQAAIITQVHDDSWVALFIISPGGGTRYASHVEYGVGWEWPIVKPVDTTWNGL